ncbi:AMP-binding protein [Gillisia sp. M10.2A]|uniref:AMP-binding protein n=1 Tax=Gillisia lutea TaxID=2909668 RepID=A0ABS9EFH3_9FLAO|nr:AMP-binding protein [Gillisia lutea]MCF4101629.1 AMP-binding protein [Gillisia lutea]
MTPLYTESLSKIKQKQWLEVQKQLLYLQKKSAFYQGLFKEGSIDVSKITSLQEFRNIPLTTKEDLQERNSDFICVPNRDIIDYVTTSGTLGSPVSFALNEADLQRLASNEMQSFEMVGLTKEDIVQITTTLDRRFMAGMAYFLGLRKLGAGIVRTGSGLPQMQWDSIQRFKPSYLVAVPSFLLKLTDYALANNIDFRNSSVKAAVCIGEPVRTADHKLNALGQKINDVWGIELFSTYASTEMATAFTECKGHKGNHIQTDLIYTEVLKDDGIPVKEGEIGELVITNLQVETMPLLRFATGDMVSYTEEICQCGRNTPRLSAVIGRKKQMIKYKGTSLYPQHIIETLNAFNEISNFVIEAHTNSLNTDILVVKVPANLSDNQITELKHHFKSQLRVIPEIIVVPEDELLKLKFPTEARKPQIFIDYR